LLASVTARSDDEQAYAARFRLVHAWRTFLFRDPQLPPSLLPDRWPGSSAAAFFDRHATRLRPAADRYVDRCLDGHRPKGS
jgi:phenylacetic acid degradation operon negative regulatory protein